jgi:alpha/beta superfamily hydrolase
MAKLMSKKTREIVTTTTVLVIVALFISLYIIYPIVTVPDMVSRPNGEQFEDTEFVPLNDPALFIKMGLNPDTISFLSGDNINLAAIYCVPDTALFNDPLGIAILLHPDDTDRTALAEYIQPLLDYGLAVILYDQRASGVSGGRYHFAGNYEADDLVDLIAYLNIHQLFRQPLIAVGFETGADAVINASLEESRIDMSIAVNPYLTTTRWIKRLKEKKGLLSIPLYNMVYFWWFQKFTGYPFDRTGTDDLRPIKQPTLIIADGAEIDGENLTQLRKISPTEILSIRPESETGLKTQILNSIFSAVGK